MTLELALDIILAGLLGTVLGYLVMVNGRLRTLRRARAELSQLVTTLNTVTEQAQNGIVALKTSGESAAADLQEKVDAARALRDELSFITASGHNLAERLEKNTMEAGSRLRQAPRRDEASTSAEDGAQTAGREKAQAILRALSGVR